MCVCVCVCVFVFMHALLKYVRVCGTLMSLMSCSVGVSMGVLLSMTPCRAAVHLMASFKILVYRRYECFLPCTTMFQ